MASSLKRTIYLLLEDPDGNDPRARLVRGFLIALILLNVTALVVETMEEVSTLYRPVFLVFEQISVVIFSVEYVLRLWTCTERDADSGVITGRLRHALSPLMLVDLIAILPFYLPLLLPADLLFLRSLRLMRLLRVFKLGRYSDAIRIFSRVILLKKEQLAVAGFGLGILLIIASSLMYHFEHLVQPGTFESIPHAMWWAIITLTTVGYGDAYPITTMGRILASIISLLGIGMFAIPAGILSAGFLEYGDMHRRKRNGSTICPHCGKEID